MARLTTKDIQFLEAATFNTKPTFQVTKRSRYHVDQTLNRQKATMSDEEWHALESDASSIAELILRDHGWTWTTLLEIDPDLHERLSDWHVAHVAQRYEETSWYYSYQSRAVAAFTELVRYHAPEQEHGADTTEQAP